VRLSHGLNFEVNLPAVAVNAEDVVSDRTLVIERTLEPAIVSDSERFRAALADADSEMLQRAIPQSGGTALGKLGSSQRHVGECLMLWH
jgi:hypothetical protein